MRISSYQHVSRCMRCLFVGEKNTHCSMNTHLWMPKRLCTTFEQHSYVNMIRNHNFSPINLQMSKWFRRTAINCVKIIDFFLITTPNSLDYFSQRFSHWFNAISQVCLPSVMASTNLYLAHLKAIKLSFWLTKSQPNCLHQFDRIWMGFIQKEKVSRRKKNYHCKVGKKPSRWEKWQ